ncbi:hypothetical protein AB1286_07780 [Trinickia sp. NRRL B-1857]|uniref:hypothetical protein n=1 Tax=Trinickia sp. NRRL B-1857 TaxID=3162879 RepID=UPI003D2CE618
MDAITVKLTSALVQQSTIHFSAYEFGWGDCAFAIPHGVAQSELGAADESPKQLTLAFELSRPKLQKMLSLRTFDCQGKRISLSVADLRQ